jgi:hypothetical protein
MRKARIIRDSVLDRFLDRVLALRGAALYKLSWFDAQIWACADERGLR